VGRCSNKTYAVIYANLKKEKTHLPRMADGSGSDMVENFSEYFQRASPRSTPQGLFHLLDALAVSVPGVVHCKLHNKLQVSPSEWSLSPPRVSGRTHSARDFLNDFKIRRGEGGMGEWEFAGIGSLGENENRCFHFRLAADSRTASRSVAVAPLRSGHRLTKIFW